MSSPHAIGPACVKIRNAVRTQGKAAQLKEMADELQTQGQRVQDHERKLGEQQEFLNQTVKYSMSGYERSWIKWSAIVVAALVLLALGGWRAYEHWVDCGKFVDRPIVHRAGRDTAHYVREGNPDRVIVFIHGIFGDAEGTWTSPPDIYWPELIAGDEQFGKPDIYVAAYDTGVGNRMHMDEVAEGLYERFVDAGVFTKHRQVIFVCHSLGGLVAERLLLKHRDIAEKIPLIYFYGTPQTGAQIARVGSVFSDDPLLNEMAPGASNDYLRSMESDWRNAGFSMIHRLCAYEKLKYKCVLVVDDLSGTWGCDNAVAVNKNHATLVKPRNMQDDSYILLRNAWRDLPGSPVDNTAEKAGDSKSMSGKAPPEATLRGRLTPVPSDAQAIRILIEGEDGESMPDRFGRFRTVVHKKMGDRVGLTVCASGRSIYDNYVTLSNDEIEIPVHKPDFTCSSKE